MHFFRCLGQLTVCISDDFAISPTAAIFPSVLPEPEPPPCTFPSIQITRHFFALSSTAGFHSSGLRQPSRPVGSVEHDSIYGSQSKQILQLKTGSDLLSKKSTGSDMDIQTALVTAA